MVAQLGCDRGLHQQVSMSLWTRLCNHAYIHTYMDNRKLDPHVDEEVSLQERWRHTETTTQCTWPPVNVNVNVNVNNLLAISKLDNQ